MKHEHTAMTKISYLDVRLAFLDAATAMQSIEPVSRVMAEALGWNEKARKEKVEQVQVHLRQWSQLAI